MTPSFMLSTRAARRHPPFKLHCPRKSCSGTSGISSVSTSLWSPRLMVKRHSWTWGLSWKHLSVSRPRHQSACFSTNAGNFQTWIDALAGEWGDDIGLTIKIKGCEAWFSDGTGPWTFEEVDGALTLRGASLIGTPDAPIWKFPHGVERCWARPEPAGSGNSTWAEALLSYKERRLSVRQELRAAFSNHDLDRIVDLKMAWAQKGDLPSGVTEDESMKLAAGRNLVPGVCFRHKKFDYRGVILGCDPWCFYPTAWRALWVPNRPHGEAQPFYHCLVDSRDRPGRQSRYVAEENIELSEFIFPLEAELVDALLVRCDPLGGYLPGPQLDNALRRQRTSGKFSLS